MKSEMLCLLTVIGENSPSRKVAVIDALCEIEERFTPNNYAFYWNRSLDKLKEGGTFKDVVLDLTL